MSKKSDKGDGVSFSPELGEVIRRLKRKEPELDELDAILRNQELDRVEMFMDWLDTEASDEELSFYRRSIDG